MNKMTNKNISGSWKKYRKFLTATILVMGISVCSVTPQTVLASNAGVVPVEEQEPVSEAEYIEEGQEPVGGSIETEPVISEESDDTPVGTEEVPVPVGEGQETVTPTPAPSITATPTPSVKTGFFVNKKTGKAFFYNKNGVKVKNKWRKVEKKWRYFGKKGVMVTDSLLEIKGNTYYVDSEGIRASGFVWVDGILRYFNPEDGTMRKSGFFKLDGKKYYINKKTGQVYANKRFTINHKKYWAGADGSLQKGFFITKKNKKLYYTKKGAYTNGLYRINGYPYYMNANGVCAKGWKTIDGKRYYFRKSGADMGAGNTGGTHTIGGRTYVFSEEGYVLREVNLSDTTQEERTIKNFLKESLKPVGSTLYIWGGGHDDADATRKGVNPNWEKFYNSQSGSYDYTNYRFRYGSGLDCSGFVGWSIYQVMHNTSGQSFYTSLAEDVARDNANRGFGTLYNQTQLSADNYKFVPGDLACTSGHTWIVLGQCTDGSVVLVHATPPCVQIAGTPTPDGSYTSKAIKLAQEYMSKYYGDTVAKFGLRSSAGTFYIKGCNVMRWNEATLGDPEGYRNMSAKKVLASLFAE